MGQVYQATDTKLNRVGSTRYGAGSDEPTSTVSVSAVTVLFH